MKYYIFLPIVLFILISCGSQSEIVSIASNKNVPIDNQGLDSYEATIKNKSFQNLEVTVVDNSTNVPTSGFGLGKKAKADVIVNTGQTLYISNPNNKSAKVKVGHRFMEAEQIIDPKKKTEYVSFSLVNNTAKSIPLIIPTVMNPNLSPFSRSGVDLKYGQEVFFKAKGKKRILLVVDDSIKNGDTIEVGKLLKQRKKELNL